MDTCIFWLHSGWYCHSLQRIARDLYGSNQILMTGTIYAATGTCNDWSVMEVARTYSFCLKLYRKLYSDQRTAYLQFVEVLDLAIARRFKSPQTHFACVIRRWEKRNGELMLLCSPWLRSCIVILETTHSLGVVHGVLQQISRRVCAIAVSTRMRWK